LEEAERLLQQCPAHATFAQAYRDAAQRVLSGGDASAVVRIPDPLSFLPTAITMRAP
jgi:hypothetical protein